MRQRGLAPAWAWGRGSLLLLLLLLLLLGVGRASLLPLIVRIGVRLQAEWRQQGKLACKPCAC